MKINNFRIKKSIKFLEKNECIGIPTDIDVLFRRGRLPD